MATSSTTVLSSLIPSINSPKQQLFLLQNRSLNRSQSHRKRVSSIVQAAKPPAGVEFPKVQPQFKPPLLGFTKSAEIWNSRACMIGIIGVFIVESIINKGILQVIGVEVGKGLDLPL
ncbi:hypothetical protein RJT34_15792 [Clitoria ternatea]|uniref:Uncharacterized protein n=1 Tax=Clitoria ternatea TaxID=43366 RepID=A0AAN9J766_CLITE